MSSLIPAPTVSTILRSKPQSKRPFRASDDEEAALKRSQRLLERKLQDLLDAQSLGLAAQVGQATSQGEDNRGASHVSLRDARRGISFTMQELAEMKTSEFERHSAQSEQLQHIVTKASNWNSQRLTLQRDIERIHQAEANESTDALTVEDGAVQEEINALEEKLSRLRLRQRTIRSRISEIQNSKASRISSYQTALSTLDNEVAMFLRMPVPDVLLKDGDSILATLPPKRRTLDMLIDEGKQTQSMLSQNEHDLQRNVDALTEGCRLWDDVVQTVETFEYQLRLAINSIPQVVPATENESESSVSERKSPLSEDPAGLLSQIRNALQSLQTFLKHAEDKGWILLIAAIGAELEAFKQGQTMLEALLQPPKSPTKAATQALASEAEIDDPASLLLSQPPDAEVEEEIE